MDEDIDQFGRSYKEQNNTHVSEQKKQSEKIKDSLANIKKQLIEENFEIKENLEKIYSEEIINQNKKETSDKIKELENKITKLELNFNSNLSNKLDSIDKKISKLNTNPIIEEQIKINNNTFFEIGNQLNPLKNNAVLVISKKNKEKYRKLSFIDFINLILSLLIIYTTSALLMILKKPYKLEIFGSDYLIKLLNYF